MHELLQDQLYKEVRTMAVEYQLGGKDVVQLMEQLIRAHHPDLVCVIDRIKIMMRFPASKVNGEVLLGKASKVSDKMNAFAQTNDVYLLEIAGEEWEITLDDVQREALMFHMLSSIEVVVNDDGEEKYNMRPYDVVGFRDEFERYGVGWRPKFDDDPLPPLNMKAEVNPDRDPAV